jgi:hypothetical protein
MSNLDIMILYSVKGIFLFVCLSFICISLYLWFDYFYHGFRYINLLIKAEEARGDCLKDEFKKGTKFWKLRLAFYILTHKIGFEIFFLGDKDSMSSEAYYFSKSEAYVKGSKIN